MANRGSDEPRKRKGAIPPLDPGTTQQLNEQKALLLQGYGNTKSALATQEGLLRSAYQNQIGGIRKTMIGSLAAAENSALGRGILGSSSDIQARIGVKSDEQASLTEARNAMIQGLLATKSQSQQARTDYSLGQLNLEAARAAALQQQQAQDLLADLLAGQGGGGGGGFGGGGGAGGGAGAGGGQGGSGGTGGNQQAQPLVARAMNWGLSGNWTPEQLTRALEYFSSPSSIAKDILKIGPERVARWARQNVTTVKLREQIFAALRAVGWEPAEQPPGPGWGGGKL